MFEGTNQIDHDHVAKQQVFETYGKIPMSFEVNQGQTDEKVRFLSRGNGYTLFLTSNDAVLTLVNPQSGTSQDKVSSNTSEVSIIHMKLVGANYLTEPKGLDKIDTKSNYFVGNDPQKWFTDIPNYAKIKYEDVYSGIDLVFYGNQQQLEYDFIVNPGADPNLIRFFFEGAENFYIDSEGNLVLEIDGGKIIQKAPVIFQQNNGVKNFISGNYIIVEDKKLGINVGQYDHELPLIIDPVLIYSTFLGGSSSEIGFSIAVDGSGNAYVTGRTASIDFPTFNPIDGTTDGNLFVSKINSAGSALVYSTFIGGPGAGQGTAIAVDGLGNAYVAGTTALTDFPTVNPIDDTHNGGFDAFVTKINPAGSALVYSTFLGGSRDDFARGIAVDDLGNAYVTGSTNSPEFPTASQIDDTHNGGTDVFVSKINSAGSLVYSTFLGGSGSEGGSDIAVDGSGNAYVTGFTISLNFPTANPIDDTHNGDFDAFITKINPAGDTLVYSTYLGGSSLDAGAGIAVDDLGNAYVTGSTASFNFPTTVNPIADTLNDSFDAFITKINSAGDTLVYSTFLGGSDIDAGAGIAVDDLGNAYVIGTTASTDFPTADPIDGTHNGNNDAFITKINPAGDTLVYSTFLGGSDNESGEGIAVDGSGNAYVTGSTASFNFPTTVNPIADTLNGVSDVFVSKIGEATDADGDGVFTPTDCDDTRDDVFPGAPEVCDGVDNNCDGSVDEGITQSCGTDVGACQAGIQTCTDGAFGSCIGETVPTSEVCNGADDDCDGISDNNAADSSCDDGLFCNGSEICEQGSCQAGTPPASDDGAACTDDSCDEANDVVVNTPNDANCDANAVCTALADPFSCTCNAGFEGTGDVCTIVISPGDFIVVDSGNLLRVTPAGSVGVIASGLGSPFGVAIDSGGDFIVTEIDGSLLRVTPGGIVTEFASGGLLSFPLGVAVDFGGDFIVADQGGRLLRVTPAGIVTEIASGGLLSSPVGVDVDSGGDFIVTEGAGGGRLLRVTPDDIVTDIAIGVLGAVAGVAVDSNGDFIMVCNLNFLCKVTPFGPFSVITSSGLGSPSGVAIDSGGDFIVTDQVGRLLRVTPAGSVEEVITSELGIPFFLAIVPPVLVDECADPALNNCDVNAVCTDTPDSFTCTCNVGFSGNGVTCTDINECTDGTDNCSLDAVCSNTPGSFSCECNVGFSGNGVTCTDINECTDGTDNCSLDATCANTPGSFTCTCNVGFGGNGLTCTALERAVVAQGFDLFETRGSAIDGAPFEGLPLGEFDFGSGPVDTGTTDTIVQRLQIADGFVTQSATVDIEIVALQLRSVDPIDLGCQTDRYFVTLQPDAPSIGRMTITFDDQDGGTFDSFFDVFFDVRTGSPNGEVCFSRNVLVESQNVQWDRTPDPSVLIIDGVNHFLLSPGDDSEDFFPAVSFTKRGDAFALTVDPSRPTNQPPSAAVTQPDRDADGLLDVEFTLRDPESDRVSVLVQFSRDGGSSFQDAGLNSLALSGQNTLDVSEFPTPVSIGDLNGDGRNDLAVAGNSRVTVYLQNVAGDLVESSQSPLSAGIGLRGVSIGDLNGDGRNDLAVSSLFGVTVFLQDVAGDLVRSPGLLEVGSNPIGVSIGDLNGDGRADLAVANSGSGSVTVYLQDVDGSLELSLDSPLVVGADPRDLSIGDLNGDGRNDLAVSDVASADVTVYLQAVDGSLELSPDSPLRVEGQSSGVSIGDLNGDGRNDLAVANFNTDDVTIYLQAVDGSLELSPDSPLSVGRDPFGLSVGDLNGDGRADLAVVNVRSADVTVYLQAVDGSLALSSQSPLGAGQSPRSVSVGDLNGDGRADLAVVNFGTNDVTVYLQQPLQSSPDGVPHTFVWDYGTQLGLSSNQVVLRVSPFDAFNAGTPGTTEPFFVGNDPPVAVITGVPNPGIGAVEIRYTLFDSSADLASIQAEFSLDDGGSFSPATTQVSQTSNLQTADPDDPSEPFAHTFVWDSIADIGPQRQGPVVFRITPSDEFEAGSAATFRFELEPLLRTAVAAGFDLFETDSSFDFGAPFEGLPLREFDFGRGLLEDTGSTDTIVLRLEPAVVFDTLPQTAATIPIELVALQLRSVEPVDLGCGVDDYFITLVSIGPPGPGDNQIAERSFGQMTITFDDQDGGTFDSFFDVFFDVRTGSPNGDVCFSRTVLVESQNVQWNRTPDPSALLIDGVNHFLLGPTDDSEDFFPELFTLVGADVEITVGPSRQLVNECTDPDLNTCDENALCTDTPLSFTCECREGFDGDGFVCDDIEPPTITGAGSTIIVSNDSGRDGAIVPYLDPVVDDNVGVVSVICVPASGSFFSIGTTIVTCTAFDAAGNSAQDTFTVTVLDNEPPKITSPQNIEVFNDLGMAGAVVTFDLPPASDNVAVTSLSCTPPSGTKFSLGINTVECIAFDAAGNSNNAVFTVTVIDNEDPQITAPGPITKFNDLGTDGALVNYIAPVGTDNDNDPEPVTVQTAGLGPGGFFPIGVTTETYRVTDNSGNTAEASFDITIIDNEVPMIITDLPDLEFQNDPGQAGAVVIFDLPEFIDNSGEPVDVTCEPPSGFFPLGTTIVNCTAIDVFGNEAVSSFRVTVSDSEAPVITTTPDDIIRNTDPGRFGAVVAFGLPTATDNSGVFSVVCVPPSPSFFSVGSFTINCTVTDAAGNQAATSFTITVVDNEDPTITDLPNIEVPNDEGLAGAFVTFDLPTATDNVAVRSVSCVPPSGTFFPIGLTLVNCTATDVFGNEAVSPFTVIVNDEEPPIITVPPDRLFEAIGLRTPLDETDYGTATAVDNADPPPVITSDAPDDFPEGATPIEWTATDSSGNTATGIQIVTLAVIDFPAKGGGADVNDFLKFGGISETTIPQPPGTRTFDLLIKYGQTTDPLTFTAVLDGVDLIAIQPGLFNPAPGFVEVVSIPLNDGRNTLNLSIDGEKLNGRTANDKDSLVFKVG